MTAGESDAAVREGLIGTLICAGSERATRIIRLHPERTRLAGRLAQRGAISLRLLMERQVGEPIGSRATVSGGATRAARALRYWLLRRRRAALLRLRRRELVHGEVWLWLAQQTPGQRAEYFESMGVSAFAIALRGESAATGAAWLAPLGDELARRAIDEAVALRAQRAERALVERWHRGCASVRAYRGARAVRRVGLGLLADRLRLFPPDAVDDVAALLPELVDPSAKIGLLGGVPDAELADALLHQCGSRLIAGAASSINPRRGDALRAAGTAPALAGSGV